ncbi:helicase-related protein [Dankookia rubra]|uniref:helicase-related protein n=1 Tax=Dankookia rubra TaxID=1442381 RepID=UPI001F4F63FC|nr:helicase-related protein [Dankookia rubra]
MTTPYDVALEPADAPDEAPPHAVSPAEAAIIASGLEVEARELPALIRRVERRLPADAAAVGAALREVRRRAWVSRLNHLASKAGRTWVRRADAEAAAGTITELTPEDETLLVALDAALGNRFRSLGHTPEETLEAIVAELAETAKGAAAGTLAPDRHAELAREVAAAFGLKGEESLPFLEAVGATEARRRREVREAETAARAKRREEVQRLRTWEKSLVEFRDVSGLLGCVEKEALRWVAAGLIPVARRIPQKGGREKWEFDPAELASLRALVPQWREADKTALDAKRRTGVSAPPIKLGRGASAAIARVAALDRYAGHFATARALNRRITLITGPTNSGKSHTALDRLAKAENGMALAPLRLLAHEFRDALQSRGVPASLSTGEERIPVAGARHLAATVEMCPFHLPVDVALIDEAQMLGDRDRGAAWTAAIMGAPARDVFVLGAPEAATQVRRIAALCGDPMEEISLKRKGPLTAARTPIPLGDLQTGDAIVAFSRRDVLDMRAELVRRGRRVAVVYGALSPEVRRAEAARFRDGDADILVATDAIGMGLNLPIRRVIFSTLRKFDGEMRRELNTQEVKQIGGRAGRYGRFEEGVVAVLAGGGSPEFIRTMLEADPMPPEDPRPLVQPDADIIANVAQEIGSDSLFGVLARIKRAVLRPDDPNYRLADLTQAMAVAGAIDGVAGLTLLERWTYAMCPVDERDNGTARLARWAIEHGAGRPVQPPSAGRLPAPERASRDELERAEKTHKRLVAWRWLALRFPQAYVARDEANGETERLDRWIEDVLRQQRRSKLVA